MAMLAVTYFSLTNMDLNKTADMLQTTIFKYIPFNEIVFFILKFHWILSMTQFADVCMRPWASIG